MKLNSGNHPADVTPIPRQTGSSPSRWYHPKLFSRILSLSLVLFGNVIIHLPTNPVLAAVACTPMRRGDQGENVRALQQTLSNNNYNVGAIDGAFGELTEITIKSFQRANNLDPDGVVGPATCNALINLSGSELIAAPAPPAPATPAQPAPSTAPSTSASAGGATATTLQRGDTGAEVTVLQNALRARGYESQQVTGVFDAQTENTVKRFQFVEGLPQTGKADPTTKAKLSAYLNNNAGVPATPTPTPTPTANPLPIPAAPPKPDVIFSSPQPSPAPQISMSNGDSDRYQVVVPLRGNDSIFGSVRNVVAGATLDRTRLGTFVNAGSYSNRFDAESLSNTLKARGFDARVVKQ